MHKKMKLRAEEQGLILTLLPAYTDGSSHMNQGVNVYQHREGVDVAALTQPERDQLFLAWLMELPPGCAC